MTVLIELQVHIFFTALVIGIILGLGYDLLRILRRCIKHNIYFISIEDIIFWLIAIIILFKFLRKQNAGEVRGFIIMSLMLGAYFYFLTASKYIIKIGTYVLNILINSLNALVEKIINFWKLLKNFYKKYLQINKIALLYNKDTKKSKSSRKI